MHNKESAKWGFVDEIKNQKILTRVYARYTDLANGANEGLGDCWRLGNSKYPSSITSPARLVVTI